MDKKNLLFDIRLVERNLKKGVIDQKDYEKFLKGLPDMEGEYEEDSLFSSKLNPEMDQEKD